MLYRRFGKTDEKVSILGFGCMRFQVLNDDYGQIDEPKSIQQVRHAIDKGVNYLDSAYIYHKGNSESFLGKALKGGYREKVFVATKLPSWLVKSREDMDKLLDEQLERLQTDYIDFYLIHALNSEFWANLKKHDLFDFLDKAKKEGKIRYAGFSFHDGLPLFKEIVDAYDWSFCQIQYNYLDENYQAGIEGLEYAASKDLGVVIMEPLRGGSLARNIPKNIQAIWNKSDKKRTPAEWALRFIWNHPGVSIVLSGMNTIEQIDENIETASEAYPHSLSQEELSIINEVKTIYKNKMRVNCTNCKYCIPCPVGVNIPECFLYLNNAYIFDDIDKAKSFYGRFIPEEEHASKCIDCGQCETKCPQQIEIREKLKEVVHTFETK